MDRSSRCSVFLFFFLIKLRQTLPAYACPAAYEFFFLWMFMSIMTQETYRQNNHVTYKAAGLNADCLVLLISFRYWKHQVQMLLMPFVTAYSTLFSPGSHLLKGFNVIPRKIQDCFFSLSLYLSLYFFCHCENFILLLKQIFY